MNTATRRRRIDSDVTAYTDRDGLRRWRCSDRLIPSHIFEEARYIVPPGHALAERIENRRMRKG